MTGCEKFKFFIKHFIIIHIVFILFIIYRIFLSIITYTASGTRDSAHLLIPTTLIFPLIYLFLSLMNLIKKDYFKFFMFFPVFYIIPIDNIYSWPWIYFE